ncbi:MAG TPA: biotin--[acetyl-CoA-carboxylase] ligase [Kiritimatiellae bacterium]|nr:biotin--[acetyl-CoA-carboxylase] ligase [Kiritimatiellia bacterium]
MTVATGGNQTAGGETPWTTRVAAFFSRTLEASLVGRVIRLLEVVDSTSLEARRMAESGCPLSGTAVLAREQTAGRGRLGRRWISAPDMGVYLSLLFAVAADVPLLRDAALLAMAGTVAVCRALEERGLTGVAIKRPNDILAQGRKIAGVLVEVPPASRGVRYQILGVGINVSHPAEFWSQGDWKVYPVSLEELGISVPPDEVACAFLNQMDRLVREPEGGADRVVETAWSELSGRAAPPNPGEVIKGP